MMKNKFSQKILDELQTINGRLERLEADVSVIKEDIVEIKEDIVVLKEDMLEVKEHAEITRNAANELVRWVDQASPTVHVNFPYRKKEST